MSYRDEDDLTISRTSQLKRFTEMQETEREEREIEQKKFALDPKVTAIALFALSAIALLALSYFCPPLGIGITALMIGGLGVATIILLILLNAREEKKLKVKKCDNNMVELRNLAQGRTKQEKTFKAKMTGKSESREVTDSDESIEIATSTTNIFYV